MTSQTPISARLDTWQLSQIRSCGINVNRFINTAVKLYWQAIDAYQRDIAHGRIERVMNKYQDVDLETSAFMRQLYYQLRKDKYIS